MPYQNEHACRLVDPGAFQEGSFRRMTRVGGRHPEYDVIMGRKTGATVMSDQAFRYPKAQWSAADARAHCRSHNGISFEAAADGEE